MTWNTHPTVVTGSTWTAADHNLYVKGNLDTLFPYTAGQQVAYSTSSASLNKATASAALMVLRSNSSNTAIEFGGMIAARQGFSTTDWYTTSTSTAYSNSTPAKTIFQCGDAILTSTATVITFPIAYTYKPLVFVDSNTASFYFLTVIPTTTGATVYANSSGISFSWMAIGE